MKTILCITNLLFFLSACNKSQDNIGPSEQNILGMVLKTADQKSSSLILLKDGRAIKTVSGFNPSSVRAGNKFVLSFEPIGSAGNKILNVKVKSFTNAEDSTFTPPPIALDSAILRTTMQGLLTGIFNYATVNNTNVGDTTKMSGPAAITFNNTNYTSAPSSNGYPLGGAGTFRIGINGGLFVVFNNTQNFPAGTNESLILKGIYNCAIFDTYIALWAYTNTTYSGYLLNK